MTNGYRSSKKHGSRHGKNTIVSDVPFVPPHHHDDGNYEWNVHGSVVKTTSGSNEVMFRTKGGVESTLSATTIYQEGRRAFHSPKSSDREKTWGCVLCSAAVLSQRR